MSKSELEGLMSRALKGDKQAYERVLHDTAGFLRPFLSQRLKDKSAVEDVLQEILISIHKARHTYDAKRPYMPWAYAIARFRLADHLRSHYADKLQFTENIESAADIAAPDVTEAAVNYESIKAEIYKLPGKQPMILHLMHDEGYTAKEVAKRMGMTETAVKVSAHRAYKVLRKRLKKNV